MQLKWFLSQWVLLSPPGLDHQTPLQRSPSGDVIPVCYSDLVFPQVYEGKSVQSVKYGVYLIGLFYQKEDSSNIVLKYSCIPSSGGPCSIPWQGIRQWEWVRKKACKGTRQFYLPWCLCYNWVPTAQFLSPHLVPYLLKGCWKLKRMQIRETEVTWEPGKKILKRET